MNGTMTESSMVVSLNNDHPLQTDKVTVLYSDMMEITRCGLCWRDIPDDSNFCPYCGAKFLMNTTLKRDL